MGEGWGGSTWGIVSWKGNGPVWESGLNGPSPAAWVPQEETLLAEPCSRSSGMATSSWEIPADPFRPVSNDTYLEMPQPSSEHSFPPYVVICVHTVLRCSKHKLTESLNSFARLQ